MRGFVKANKSNARYTVRILVLLSLFMLIINILLGTVLIIQSTKALKEQIQDRMLDVSNTAADMIDGDKYEILTEADRVNNTAIYQEIFNTLFYFQDNIELEYIYSIRDMGDSTFIFTVDPAIENSSEYGELVHVTEALLTASKGVAAVDEVPYEDSYGRFYSAYSPIFNSKGEQVGIVAVDMSAKWFDEHIKKNVRTIIIITVLTLVAGVSVMLWLMNYARRASAEANKMITALSSDYRSVYYVDLDKDEGICYREHSKMKGGLAEGEVFDFQKTFTSYAEKYVTEQYREGFLKFITPKSIRENLENEDLISHRYLINRDNQESYEMLKMAGVRHPEDRIDHIVHAVGIGFADVDAETRATLEKNQALSDALVIAHQANAAKTAFLSSISHELRTPINEIIGIDNMALQDSNINDPAKKYFEKNRNSAEHLLGIIDDILDISRIETGKVFLKKEKFSFTGLIEEICPKVEKRCTEKNISFRSEIDENIEDSYIGDDGRLKQVILNVLDNAVKFTQSGGEILLGVKRTAEFKGNATFQFTIKDNGIGMDESFIPRIFDAFSQENASNTNKYGSTGLGMAISKNIVEMMNGDIAVESKKGEGTIVVVTVTLGITDLKTNIEEKKNSDNKDSIDFSLLEGKRILLAEDMDTNAEIMKRILSSKKIEVERAENGKVAVDKFMASKEHFFDIVLMDIRMPVMDGLEATKLIRSLDRDDAKTVPILALSANALEEDVQRSLQAGMNAHLTKPIVPRILFEKLNEFV